MNVAFMYIQRHSQQIAKGLEIYTNTILSSSIILGTAFWTANELSSTPNKKLNELLITDGKEKLSTKFKKGESSSQYMYFQKSFLWFCYHG